MDLNQIREILDGEEGKLIIIEQGKQPLVIASLDEYKKGRGGSQKNLGLPLAAQAGQGLPVEHRFITAESRVLPKELADEPLKIEDLPV